MILCIRAKEALPRGSLALEQVTLLCYHVLAKEAAHDKLPNSGLSTIVPMPRFLLLPPWWGLNKVIFDKVWRMILGQGQRSTEI